MTQVDGGASDSTGSQSLIQSVENTLQVTMSPASETSPSESTKKARKTSTRSKKSSTENTSLSSAKPATPPPATIPEAPKKSVRDILRKGTNGLSPNFPREAYSAIPAINPSSLAKGVRPDGIDPLAIRNAYEKKFGKSSDAMDRGTLAHMILLQPERLDVDVAIWPDDATRRGKVWDEFQAANFGKLIIRQKDHDFVSAVMRRWEGNPRLKRLVEGLSPETAVFTHEEVWIPNQITRDMVMLRVACKGQIDAIDVKNRVIVDIKTTEAGIDKRSVHNTIRNFHYREKMSLYRRWAAKETQTEPQDWVCYNLFLSLGEDPGMHIAEFDLDALAWGEDQMLKALQRLIVCIDRSEWPVPIAESVVGVEMWEVQEEEVEIEYDE